jgi:hypothetical protein
MVAKFEEHQLRRRLPLASLGKKTFANEGHHFDVVEQTHLEEEYLDAGCQVVSRHKINMRATSIMRHRKKEPTQTFGRQS